MFSQDVGVTGYSNRARARTYTAPGLESRSQTDGGAPDSDQPAKMTTEEMHDEYTARLRIILAVTVGDALHNLADGAFIGVAFLSCNPSLGWTVVLGTVVHEVSQELADFLVLTSAAGVSVVHAMVLNFLAGTSIYIGCAIVALADVSSTVLGVILVFGAGVYVYTACVEALPAIEHAPNVTYKASALVLYALGATAIGLVLINHQHCGHEGGHEGHDH